MDSLTLSRIDKRTKVTLWFAVVTCAAFIGIVIGQTAAISPIKRATAEASQEASIAKAKEANFEALATDAIVKILDFESSDSLDTPKQREDKRQLLIQIRDRLKGSQEKK